MFASAVARNVIKWIPPLKCYTLSRHLSLARTATPTCSLLLKYELSQLSSALAVMALAPTIGTALARGGPGLQGGGHNQNFQLVGYTRYQTASMPCDRRTCCCPTSPQSPSSRLGASPAWARTGRGRRFSRVTSSWRLLRS